jgi:hypothetical protein
MSKFILGNIVKLLAGPDREARLIIAVVENDAKPLKCIALSETEEAASYLNVEAYSNEEVRLAEPTEYSLASRRERAQNAAYYALRDMYDKIPNNEHPNFSLNVSRELYKDEHTDAATRQVMEKVIGKIESDRRSWHAAMLEFLLNPDVSTPSFKLLEIILRRVTQTYMPRDTE